MSKEGVKESYALDTVDHVAINVADIEKSVSWYTSSFGCDVLHQDDLCAILSFANLRLILVLPSQQPPHLGFEREDAAEFGELKRKIDGANSCFLSDPTGNLIEIIKK